MLHRIKDMGDGVSRIRLDSECGLVVNAFLVRSGTAVALVDTGFPHTVDQLADALSEVGLDLEEVTDVFYTHTHIDHMGGGAALAPRWSPRNWVWEGTTPAFGDYYAWAETIREQPEWPLTLVEANRASDPLVAEMRSKPQTPLRCGGDGTLGRVHAVPFDGEVSVGELRFRCIDGRGHDPYHCGWLEPRRGWLFSGDVALAVPTPLVASMNDDVRTWLDTLDRWERELDVSWLLPGHGMPTRLFAPAIARSRKALVRIYDELRRQLVSGGAVDPLEVTRGVLPADRSRFAARSRVLLATVETLLGELERQGVVARTDCRRWTVTRDVPALDHF